MTSEYEEMCPVKVTEENDNEYLDFQARRLVEMAGNIIMGYLLLMDARRDMSYFNAARIFIY
jgi:3-(methylthio)propanoyl-CoA dehydrogenase